MNVANPYTSKLAAVVCGDIAMAGKPITYAERTEPIEKEDSGWQFFCGENSNEDPALAQVWSISEVIAREPSLAGLINLPVGTVMRRDHRSTEWSISNSDE